MSVSIRAGRRRVLAITASVLLSGAALAATAGSASALPPPGPPPVTANTITLLNPGTQETYPIAPVFLPITATETNPLDTLTFAVTSEPVGPFSFPVAQPEPAGSATADLKAAFTKAYAGTVTVTVTDGIAADAVSQTFTWSAGNAVLVTNPGPQRTNLGAAVDLPIAAADSGGLALTYTAGGTLPTGLVINPTTGVITGKPTLAGSFPVTITVTDPGGSKGDAVFTWTVVGKANKIAVTAPAAKTGWLGVPVTLKVTATDSGAGQALAWTAAKLPLGLAINPATGVISGRPTKAGAYTSVVTATDGTGGAGSATIKWTIAVPVIIPDPGTLKTSVGQWLDINPFPYRDAVPGDRPTFSATGLPSGMGFQGNPMLLWGWPTAAGTYHVTIHERGSLGSTDAMTFRLIVTAPISGAIGQIHLPFAGKCLQDPGNKIADGTRIDIATCVAGDTERWTIASDNTIRVNGRCLSVAGNGGYARQQLDLWTCGGSPRQRWAQGTAGDLVNPASGLCVTDPGSSKRNGTLPVMGTCYLRSYEQWVLPAQRVLTALGGSCLDTSGAAALNQRVDMFWCKYSGSQWTFEQDGSIRMFGNKCISVNSKNLAVLGLCSARNATQKWAVIRVSATGSELAERGVCLAIPSMTAGRGTELETNGAQLMVTKCNAASPRDLWHIE